MILEDKSFTPPLREFLHPKTQLFCMLFWEVDMQSLADYINTTYVPGRDDEQEQNQDQDTSMIDGYDARDLLQAPLKSPNSLLAESEESTSNPKVAALIGLAVLLLIAGAVLVLVWNAMFGLVIALLAAMTVVVAVFLPIPNRPHL